MNKRIVIIGGGIAGLSAGADLQRNGYAVTILEAKDRFGGWIYTRYEQNPDPGVRAKRLLPMELGAEFLHGQSTAILKAIRAAGLKMQVVSDRNRILENGRLRRIDIWGRMSRLVQSVDPREPDRSVRQFLNQKRLSRRSRQMAIGFVQGFHGAQLECISAHALLRGEYAAHQMRSTMQRRINEGYAGLVAFLEKKIRDRGGVLVKGAKVRKVRWETGRVEIDLQRAGIAESLVANAALVTLPLGVLKTGKVKFDPPLTAKRDAIEGMEFGNAIRIVLLFRERWWPGKDFGFIHAFDKLIPTWWSDPRGPTLTGWAGGPKCDALYGCSPMELEALSLRVLGSIFSERPSVLRARLLAVHSHDWTRDPHIGGAYSYIPVNGLDLPKLLAAPLEGTLFFAGEATVTDAQSGTVVGAYDSGLRAADELINA